MQIKKRIIILVFGAGLFVSLLFSVVVFLELIEQPFMILDTELKEAANRSISFSLNSTNEAGSPSHDIVKKIMESYWVEIYQPGSKNILYQSPLAKKIKLPLVEPAAGGVTKIGEQNGTAPSEANQRKINFRIRSFDFQIHGRHLRVQIARSIDKLEEEIRDLVWGIVAGLAFSCLALIFISYFVAGRILKPIGAMNALASRISVNNLAERIPVDQGKDEINQLARTMNGMLDRLQFSFVRQKEYLASASHELQSPLAMLRLFFEEAGQRDDLPAALQAQLNLKLHGVLRMERLVKSLLELSVLEVKDSLDMEAFSLTSMIREVVQDFSPLISKAGIDLEVNVPEILGIKGDKQKIRRLLINLLDNALKYNNPKGKISIQVKQRDGLVNLAIFNTGPGIPRQDLERVFEHFYRVEKSRSLEHGGSGLGLAIVKEIVRLHKGTVAMESEPGAWARINITLPQSH